MVDLFLSHSSSDVEVVRQLRRHLEAGGYSCWMAPDDVSSAGSWAQQIVEAIQAARVTVVLLSERSIASEHVSREVGLAVQAGKPVLPVRIERVMLSGTLPYLLHLTQWVDAFPGPIGTHVDDIGGRVADLFQPGGFHPGRPGGPAGPGAPATPARPPSSLPPQPSAPPLPAVARTPSALPGVGMIVGGLAVAIGSVLPWVTETAGPISRTLNGFDREGVGLITLLLGATIVILGIAAALRQSRVAAVLALIAAILAGLMGGAEAVYQRQLDVLREGATLALGFGLPVLIAGAIVAAIAAIVALVRRP